MGSVTVTVVGDVHVGTVTKSVTLDDADIDRMVAYCAVKYAPRDVVGRILTSPILTSEEVLIEMLMDWLGSVSAQVTEHELALALAALHPPPPIVPR
jgi:hypothetical protein